MSGKREIKALLFDLDGTLADTDPLHMGIWIEALRPYGFAADEEFYQQRISGRLNPDIVAELLPDLSRREGTEFLEAKERRFRELSGELPPLPGLRAFLCATESLPRAVVTNAPGENARAMLRSLQLSGDFAEVVLAEEVRAGKPDPAPYAAALERLSVAAGEAVAFEDSPSGIRSAVAAGVPTVGLTTTHRPDVLISAGAALTRPDFTDLTLAELERALP